MKYFDIIFYHTCVVQIFVYSQNEPLEKVSRIIDQWRLNGDILVITGVIYFQHDVELEHPAIVFLWPI